MRIVNENKHRSADVSGNARHFCEVEFNYRIREKAFRNESLETNNARDSLLTCGYLSKWTSFLPFRVQLYIKNQHTSLKLVCCSFFFLIEPLIVPYELLYDEFLESQLTMHKYFPLSLNRRILRPRYVEYPPRQLYYG